MNKLNILIRCDASVTIGFGHVTRCLVLAQSFKEKGHRVSFAMKNHALGINKVTDQGFKVHLSPTPFNYNHWLQTLTSQLAVNIFIGDVRDGLPIQTIQQLKSKNIFTIAIDEPSDYRKACDLCFYPPHAQLEQLDWNGFAGQIKQGLEYVLLRPEFYQNYQKTANNPASVLIMMGGTDPERLTLPLVKNLLKTKTPMNLKVIISLEHPDFDEINHEPLSIYSNVTNMAHFLTTIDYAIISFGISAYELITMGIPATHICLNEDHIQASQYFQKHRLAYTLPCHELICATKIIDFKIKLDKFKAKTCSIVETILKEVSNEF